MAFDADETFRHALQLLQAGRVADAEQVFRQVLRAQPRHAGALNLLAIVMMQLGRMAEAEEFARQAAEESPASDVTFYNYGLILRALGRPADALQRFSEALQINPAAPETWNNRGVTYNDLKRYAEAIVDFDKALTIKPNYAEALCNKGKSLAGLKRYHDALDAYAKALALSPALVEAWIGRGNVCLKLKQYDDAAAAYQKALGLNGNLAEAWVGLGGIHAALKRLDAASAAFDKALTLKADLVAAWLGRAGILFEGKQFAEAFAAYDQAFKIEPEHDFVEGYRLNAKLMICDWSDLPAQSAHLIATIRGKTQLVVPFTSLSIPTSPAEQLQCAKAAIADLGAFPKLWRGEVYPHERIRIAYLSADLRDHAVAHLMAGVFEAHDKQRFDVTAYSFGPEDASDVRRRIKCACEHFVDVRTASDQAIAELVYQREIDIAVDLNGFTMDSRSGVFVRRPAPIQVNYLGYLATMGAPYMDYIVADRTVIPENHHGFYSEKIVYLPNSFQPTDRGRRIADKIFTRAETGLPQDGFVFCSFNDSYKITPDVFDIWMRILKQVDGSVLWLVGGSPAMERNLRSEVAARGVEAGRLVFAQRLPLPEYQARLRLADLFLDTLPYNAGATASDALWAELPVLTRIGDTFVGRMAASVVTAIGLPELITTTPEAYEQMAFDLATQPEKLAAIKRKLAENRLACPLFDTRRFTRHLEAAYVTMWERYQRGQPPAHFAVDAIAPD